MNASCALSAPGLHAQNEESTSNDWRSFSQAEVTTGGAADGSGDRRTPRVNGWDRHYEALVGYAADAGHARPPRGFVTDEGVRLGAWVTAQRSHYSARRLGSERVKLLERLPGWEWSAHRTRWDENYSALQRYVDVTGHASTLLERYETADGVRLGKWVANQRRRYFAGQLASERVELLERLPGWEWSARDAAWDAKYSALVRFVGDSGHARPPLTLINADGVRLGDWVRHQRRKYRAGDLPPGLVLRLERLPGWSWRIDNPAEYDAAWESAFSALELFAATYGHAQPPFKWRGDRIRLGVWVYRQRRAYRDGYLAPERAHRLEALPDWTWVGDKGPRPKGSPLNMKVAAQRGTQCPPPSQ